MKKKIIAFLLTLIFIPQVVMADTGPKPSITVTLKNIEGSDYLIDLMSDFKNRPDDIKEIVDYYNIYKDRQIYTYHEDTWYATAIRDRLLFGSIEGNSNHVHEFTYFGVPNEFKVIIELPDGTIKTTEKIKKTSFDFYITVDVNDMKVVNNSKFSFNYVKMIGILALTIVVEVVIAYLFKTKKYHIIALVNLITNLSLQFAMIKISLISSSILYFILAEIVVIIVEGLIYLKTLKCDKKKALLYTLIANIVTALLTFVI